MSAIVKTGQVAIDMASELPQIFRLASALKQAGGFLPAHIRNEGELVAIILAGAELGLAPMVSLRSIHLVQGRVTIAADQQLGMMRSAGAKTRWLADGSGGTATIEITPPGGSPVVTTYTMEDARTAGLTSKDMWKRYPAQMLRARCVSAAAKMAMPEVLAGVFVPEELEDIEKPAPARREAPAQQTRALPAEQTAEAPAFSVTVKEATAAATLDEYGLEVPTSACPRVSDKAKKYAGKLWSEVPGPLVASWLEKDASKMSEHQKEWAVYLLAKRQARKAQEAAQASALDTASEGGAWVTGEDDAEPANVQAAEGEAAQ